jgi:hypothetical protein
MSYLFRAHHEEEKMILEYIFPPVINGVWPCSPGKKRSFLLNLFIKEALGQIIEKRD